VIERKTPQKWGDFLCDYDWQLVSGRYVRLLQDECPFAVGTSLGAVAIDRGLVHWLVAKAANQDDVFHGDFSY